MRIPRFLSDLGLGLRVNLMMAAVLAGLLGVLLVVLITGLGDLTERTGRERAEQELEVIRSRFDEAKRDQLATTKLLAGAPGLSDAVGAQDLAKVAVTVAVEAAPLGFDDVHVVDQTGELIISRAESEPLSVTTGEDDLLRLALLGIETEGVIANSDNLVLAMVVPIRASSGSIVGGLVTGRDIDDGFLNEINFSRQDINLELIHNGRIVAASSTKQDSAAQADASTATADPDAVSQALEGVPIVLESLVNRQGAPHASGYIPLTVGEQTLAVLRVSVNVDNLVSFQGKLTRNIAVIFALVSLAAFGAMALFMRKSIGSPLRRLQATAERMTSGDYRQPPQAPTNDEIGRLTRSFGSMAAAVQQHAARLTSANKTLQDEVAERGQAEATITRLAYYDALTDLPNRRLFKDRLTQALAQARRSSQMLAVMFLDLDRFKLVNDTAGHPEGDKLLRSVGAQLKALVRETDTVARVGGDEFVLLLPEIARARDAVELAKRIREDFGRPRILADHEFHITPSIGIAVFPADGDDAETLLANADIAMYYVKEHGKNSHRRFSPALSASIVERLELENDLRHALQREEFVVHYQPQVNINTGQIVGMEALVRWQHPGKGLVMPVDFIPVAEETGLIVPLGEWVLRTACAQTKAWQDAGLSSVRMAVNLSARQFQQRDLVERVRHVLHETGLDPHCLELEITEGVAIQNVNYAVMMLGQLKEMGVQIAIDDFGTGHSALSYLRRLPIDVVKIDQSFISGLTTDRKDEGITATIISMAHKLKLDVIAEGVETEEQLAFLKQRLCDQMQGYLFSKALPAEEFKEMLARGERSEAA